MQILFYSFPQVLPQGPQFNAAWSSILVSIMRGLATTQKHRCHLVTGSRFRPFLAPLTEGLSVSYLDEVLLLHQTREADPVASLPTEFSRQARSTNAAIHPGVQVLMARLSEVVGDMSPDVVITFSMKADYLKALWPQAQILYVEAGAFSRSPYPFTLFFDHLGMYSEAAPSRLDPQKLQVSEGAALLAQDLRAHALRQFHLSDPFVQYDFRTRFEKLVLFPLQVSNYYSFDEQSSYRTQFEYLVDVLSQSPPEIGMVVTEYIQWGEVLHRDGGAANLDWLQRAFPNLIFHEPFRKYASPSQFLLPHVDGAYTIASNLGYQSLLTGKRLGCGPSSYLLNVAHDREPASFFRNIAQGNLPEDRMPFLAWYLERYLVPEALYTDGPRFSDYLEARIQAIYAGGTSDDAFPPVADELTLRRLWLEKKEDPSPTPYQSSQDRRIHDLAVAHLESASITSAMDAPRVIAPPTVGNFGAYLLLNDTRQIDAGLHLGCNAVTAFIESRMAQAGLACIGRINHAHQCNAVLASTELDQVKIVILNGEGFLHHDSPRLRDLMLFCELLRGRRIPSVLINSVWNENSPGFGRLLRAFDLVSVRESVSLASIRAFRTDVRLVPDLSLAAFQTPNLFSPAPDPQPHRSPWTVLDHVDARIAKVLHDFAETHGFPFHLMGQLHVEALIRKPGTTYETAGIAYPKVLQSPQELTSAEACLTGRFHGLTAAICARVPVLALSSNTPKMEGLLSDIGISREVLLGREWIGMGRFRQRDELQSRIANQGPTTRQAIDHYLAQSLRAIDALMLDILEVGRV